LDLWDLFKVDREMDSLKAEAGQLAQDVRALRAQLAALQARGTALTSELEVALSNERALNRKLADYANKRDRTRSLIETGSAPDFDAAQRQLAQLLALHDETETEALEAMEARELVEEALAEAASDASKTEAAAAAAKERETTRRPEIAARYGALKPRHAGFAKKLTNAHLSRFQELKRKGVKPVVNLVDGTCPQCHIEPPPMTLVDVARGSTRVNACRGCGAFFFEIEETETGEE
jgi:predicted  nucleic acid-binding Zn-ribbon protein